MMKRKFSITYYLSTGYILYLQRCYSKICQSTASATARGNGLVSQTSGTRSEPVPIGLGRGGRGIATIAQKTAISRTIEEDGDDR